MIDLYNDDDDARINRIYELETIPAICINNKEDLHLKAMYINWDGGYDELQDILKHPNLDQGTALLIYWFGQPMYYYQNEEDEQVRNSEGYHFIKLVEKKLLNNKFVTNEIHFDPIKYYCKDGIPTPDFLNSPIPPELKKPNLPCD